MSIDLEYAEFAVSGAAVGAAAVRQLWCAARTRRRRGANRMMAAALLLNLLLGGAATLDWADDSIKGTQTGAYPPLLWPLALFAVGAVVSLAVNARPGPAAGPVRTAVPVRFRDSGVRERERRRAA
ncbi:hypothetical protein ACEZCY_37575 [Streptacidiphilus sp. N1-12]|uniref:Uncharacterized protein n=2 Tax=Streptacidiphilus alkalitolerans TaxID=3342712 RepID=A0ABV6VMC8_9ACTN